MSTFRHTKHLSPRVDSVIHTYTHSTNLSAEDTAASLQGAGISFSVDVEAQLAEDNPRRRGAVSHDRRAGRRLVQMEVRDRERAGQGREGEQGERRGEPWGTLWLCLSSHLGSLKRKTLHGPVEECTVTHYVLNIIF